MGDWSYLRGDHPAIVRGETVVVLAGGSARDRAVALLEVLTVDTPLEDVVDVLVADGIAAAPDFFVGRREGGTVRALVRGRTVVTIEDDRLRRYRVDGRELHTWTEVAVDAVARLTVDLAGRADADAPAIWLQERPATDGPLSVAALRFRAAPAAPMPAPRVATAAPMAEPTVAAAAPTAVPAPAAVPHGVIAMPDGRRIPITDRMILGRSPRTGRTDAASLPTLVRIDDSRGDVSRLHARITVTGDEVRIEDLGSASGTLVTPAGGSALRLQAGQSAALRPGTALTVGGVRLQVEDGS